VPDNERRRLPSAEREVRILRALQLNVAIRVGELATELGVTTETIRRDLGRLKDNGLLQRMYGGATLPLAGAEPSVVERGVRRVDERIRIGRAAAATVEPGDTVMIDAGSTTALFARQLAAAVLPGLTVITNSFDVATGLSINPDTRIVICPGDYTPAEGGVVGAETVAFIARHQVAKAFIGASGLAAEGPREAHSGAASVKRAMLRAAGRRVLLADACKFGLSAFELICDWGHINALVCDARADEAMTAVLEAAGVQVVITPVGGGF